MIIIRDGWTAKMKIFSLTFELLLLLVDQTEVQMSIEVEKQTR